MDISNNSIIKLMKGYKEIYGAKQVNLATKQQRRFGEIMNYVSQEQNKPCQTRMYYTWKKSYIKCNTKMDKKKHEYDSISNSK